MEGGGGCGDVSGAIAVYLVEERCGTPGGVVVELLWGCGTPGAVVVGL